MGKKTFDFLMRRWEENQRQGGGKIIKGCGTIYTPLILSRVNDFKVGH